jgi:uncharacterized lipoprotein
MVSAALALISQLTISSSSQSAVLVDQNKPPRRGVLTDVRQFLKEKT